MARLLKTRGAEGAARLLVAECDGLIRDGSELILTSAIQDLYDGDMVLFRSGGELGAGICVSADEDGLHSMISFTPWRTFRIGLEALGEGVFAFRPAPHHMEICAELRADGAGVRIR